VVGEVGEYHRCERSRSQYVTTSAARRKGIAMKINDIFNWLFLLIIGLSLVDMDSVMAASNSEASTVVTMTNQDRFSPRELSVFPGTIVKWTNADTDPHTVTADSKNTPSSGPSSDSSFPNGLPSGQSYSWTVPSNAIVGTTWFYHCRFHGQSGNGQTLGSGMTGSIRAVAKSEINGIWFSTDKHYLMLIQDAANGTTVALEIAADLSTAKVWVGTGDNSNISLNNVKTNTDTLTASISGNSLSGIKTMNGVASDYSANLLYAYVGGAFDGIWQKTNVNNAYFAYMTINVGGTNTAVVVDLAINGDQTYTYDIFIGTAASGTYNGVSAINMNPNKTLKLIFSGSSTSGTYTTVARPPVTSIFSATQIISISQR